MLLSVNACSVITIFSSLLCKPVTLSTEKDKTSLTIPKCWPFLFWNVWEKCMRTGITFILGTWRLLFSSEYLQPVLKGPPLPLGCSCGLMDPAEGAAQGFGEPRVHQAAYTLLVAPKELQLEGHIKEKIASHLLLAWHLMSSKLSSCGCSMGAAFCYSRCWPSWLLREVVASARSLQAHWGVFMPRQPGSEERWEQGQMFSFPDENW